MLFCMREHVERPVGNRARVAHRVREPLDRLHVLREELRMPESTIVSTSASTPWKSGVSASTAVPGFAA
jgi:hypothetical protein